MLLRCEGFDPWQCERSCRLGIHLEHMMKLLKCMASKDSVEMRYKEDGERRGASGHPRDGLPDLCEHV